MMVPQNTPAWALGDSSAPRHQSLDFVYRPSWSQLAIDPVPISHRNRSNLISNYYHYMYVHTHLPSAPPNYPKTGGRDQYTAHSTCPFSVGFYGQYAQDDTSYRQHIDLCCGIYLETVSDGTGWGKWKVS